MSVILCLSEKHRLPMGTMLWRWNDETTGTILQGTAFCRQNRPGQQQSVAAALDASAGHSRHYAVSGAAVAAGKCAAESGPGRGTADPDCRFSGVGPRYRENHAGLCRPDHEPATGGKTAVGGGYRAPLERAEKEIFPPCAGRGGDPAGAGLPGRVGLARGGTPRQAAGGK